MPSILPKWLMKRYLVLWRRFKKDEFTFLEAQSELDEDSRVVGLFLSELNKNGWLNIKKNPNDSRKRIYQLRPHAEVIEAIAQTVRM